MSSRVLEAVKEPVEKITGVEITDFMVRKTAHLTEFFALGICAASAAWVKRKKYAWIPALGYCVLISFLDETLQLFVSGRAGMFSDVLIDCAGACAGIFSIIFICFIKKAD